MIRPFFKRAYKKVLGICRLPMLISSLHEMLTGVYAAWIQYLEKSRQLLQYCVVLAHLEHIIVTLEVYYFFILVLHTITL